MTASSFESALAFVLKWEGSKFTNDPDDHGGATRYGVTQRVYDAHRQRAGQPLQSVKFITMDEVRTLYRRGYWGPAHGDQAQPPLDLVLFDTGVLMGVGRATRFLQTALGVAADGAAGPATLAALAAASPRAVAVRVADLREARLRKIVANDPSQGKFLKGWLNRLNDLRRAAGLAGESAEAESAPAEDFADESVGNDGDESTVVGRADRDLPDDEDEAPASGGGAGAGIALLQPAGPAAFLAGARAVLEGAGTGELFVLDPRASSDDALRAWNPGAADGEGFDIPVQAVASVTPLGVHADGGRFLAAVAFQPGFESLAVLFRRLGGAGPGDAPAPFAATTEAAPGTADDDPAAPRDGEVSEVADLDTARTLANLGAGLAEAEAMEAPRAETAGDATLPIDMARVKAFLNACTSSSPRVTYGLGDKVPFFNAVPGKDFRKVDCSGFVREAIRRATTPRAAFPDGSVVQHEWVRKGGFRKSNYEAAFKADGAVRIAFLRPQDSPKKIGHVVLVHNGRTYESHGGVGPDSRVWGEQAWEKKAFVYRLTNPA
ncbi:glycoside hydrolase family 108 protein [Longimicrobium sp.]|jgi:lysozyme family protein|uniref:glycoside hydrolase family 108 protein n=1 Tax=Longimicrobium sp. TaxID=2029185 RepID=UPI002F936ED8